MASEVFVSRCYDVGGVGLVINGWVQLGEIIEGSIGMTFKGKKFTLVRIEKQGQQVPRASEKDRINIFVKNITRSDLNPGETIYFG